MNEAASMATEMQSKQLPPLIEFNRAAVEDVDASKRAGHYVGKDVDFVSVTTRNGAGDSVIWKFETFKKNWEQEATAGRIPQVWLDRALANYERWKSGQEIPLDGTPILAWGVLSPAQQQMLIKLNIKTVEHLAQINDEAKMRIGMGALDLQRKAQAWIAQLKEKGPLTQEVAGLKQENDLLKGSVATLAKQVEELTTLLKTQVQMGQVPTVLGQPSTGYVGQGISASDILDAPAATVALPEPPKKRGPGNPNWVKGKKGE
jgi:hypothetical protein